MYIIGQVENVNCAMLGNWPLYSYHWYVQLHCFWENVFHHPHFELKVANIMHAVCYSEDFLELNF